MDVEKVITKKAKNNATDILITLIVGELSEELNMEPDEAFSRLFNQRQVNCFMMRNPSCGRMAHPIL